ncbi:MAG: RIO1 family regulatory kinase/ATPase [archaeon]
MEPKKEELEQLKATGLEYVAKGWRSSVYKAQMGKKVAALKVCEAGTAVKEAEMLREANKVGVGPELYGSAEHIVAMEFIDGVRYADWVETAEPVDVKKVVLKILEQCRALDKAGIVHGQLSTAEKHIIVRGNIPYIIDFEKGSAEGNARNFTAVLNFILLNPNGYAAKTTVEKLNIDANEVKRYAREYSEHGEEAYAKTRRWIQTGI